MPWRAKTSRVAVASAVEFRAQAVIDDQSRHPPAARDGPVLGEQRQGQQIAPSGYGDGEKRGEDSNGSNGAIKRAKSPASRGCARPALTRSRSCGAPARPAASAGRWRADSPGLNLANTAQASGLRPSAARVTPSFRNLGSLGAGLVDLVALGEGGHGVLVVATGVVGLAQPVLGVARQHVLGVALQERLEASFSASVVAVLQLLEGVVVHLVATRSATGGGADAGRRRCRGLSIGARRGATRAASALLHLLKTEFVIRLRISPSAAGVAGCGTAVAQAGRSAS